MWTVTDLPHNPGAPGEAVLVGHMTHTSGRSVPIYRRYHNDESWRAAGVAWREEEERRWLNAYNGYQPRDKDLYPDAFGT